MVAAATTVVLPLNWTPIIAVVIPIVGTLIAVAGYLNTKTESRNRQANQVQDTLRVEIKASIENLSTLLLEKLETKETVNALKVEMATMRAELEGLRYASTTRISPPATPQF